MACLLATGGDAGSRKRPRHALGGSDDERQLERPQQVPRLWAGETTRAEGNQVKICLDLDGARERLHRHILPHHPGHDILRPGQGTHAVHIH